jgi:hypothetical protein
MCKFAEPLDVAIGYFFGPVDEHIGPVSSKQQRLLQELSRNFAALSSCQPEAIFIIT